MSGNTVWGETEEGIHRGIKGQVCDVNRDLLSVSKIVQNNNMVVFRPDGAYIEDLDTEERVWLKESNGMYTLSLWVRNQTF